MRILTINGQDIYVDDIDFGRVAGLPWYISAQGYAQIKTGEVAVSMHRFVINYGGPLFVDHIDRNKLNNQRNNLRVVEPWLNGLNRDMLCTNTSGVVGVSKTKAGKFEASTTINDRKKYIGLYNTLEEAAQAREAYITQMLATPQIRETAFESRKNNQSGHIGVSFAVGPKKWKAKLNQTHLGFFNTKEEAIAARKKAEYVLKVTGAPPQFPLQ